MGVIAPRAAGATDDDGPTQLEHFAVEIALGILTRFWFVDTEVTRRHLARGGAHRARRVHAQRPVLQQHARHARQRALRATSARTACREG